MRRTPGNAAGVVFDRAAETFDATRGFPPGVEQRAIDAIVAGGRLGPESRVLEIGVGTGRIALPLAPRVGAVFGVDLSAPMLAKLAAKRGALRVACARADAARLPFPDARFDAVLGVHVFHLIPPWREVLREAARVLRPGGRLLHAGDVPVPGDPWTEWRLRLMTSHGLEHPGVPHARFEDFPADEGWTRDGEVQRFDFARRLAPQELIDRIEQRSWSITWELGDAELSEVVAGLRADLLAHWGALDAPVDMPSSFWVRAYRPPERSGR